MPPVIDPGYNEGDAITITAHDVTIGNNEFSDANFDLALKGINSERRCENATNLTVHWQS